MNKGGVSIKTIIVLVILVLVGVLLVLGLNTVRTYMSGASAGSEPKNVTPTLSNDGKSATISWVTDKAVQGIVEYGTTPASLLLRGLETDASTNHSVTITPLKGNTNYYFRIRVGEEIYDNSGIPFSFKTKGEGASIPTPIKVAATPTIASGSPACDRTIDYNKDGVVNSVDFIVCMKGASPVPTVASNSASGCSGDVDFDKNGIVNSLDRVKCLQNQQQ